MAHSPPTANDRHAALCLRHARKGMRKALEAALSDQADQPYVEPALLAAEKCLLSARFFLDAGGERHPAVAAMIDQAMPGGRLERHPWWAAVISGDIKNKFSDCMGFGTPWFLAGQALCAIAQAGGDECADCQEMGWTRSDRMLAMDIAATAAMFCRHGGQAGNEAVSLYFDGPAGSCGNWKQHIRDLTQWPGDPSLSESTWLQFMSIGQSLLQANMGKCAALHFAEAASAVFQLELTTSETDAQGR